MTEEQLLTVAMRGYINANEDLNVFDNEVSKTRLMKAQEQLRLMLKFWRNFKILIEISMAQVWSEGFMTAEKKCYQIYDDLKAIDFEQSFEMLCCPLLEEVKYWGDAKINERTT